LDIAKAFDSAPLPAIKKSLQRLNLPEDLVNLLLSFLENREVSINTSSGPTNSFKVNNEIE